MRLSFDLPILVRGRPRKARGPVSVYCTTTYAAEVPEISLAEMEPVFTVSERREAEGELGPTRDRGATPVTVKTVRLAEPFVLRAYDGSIYRRISRSVEEAGRYRLFLDPFDERLSGRLSDSYSDSYRFQGWAAEFGGDISPWNTAGGNRPLARPLVDEFDWRLDRESVSVLLSKSAWPRSSARRDDRTRGWHAHRNPVRLADCGIADVVEEDMELALSMFRHQTDKLMIADGEIWMKSRPPAYRVQFKPSVFRGPPSQISVAMVTAPEGYVGDLLTRHYSLSDVDAAMADAEHLNRPEEWSDDYTRVLLDYRVPFECSDDTLLDYDYRQEEINRFGYTAAVEIRSFLSRNQQYASKLDGNQLSLVEEAFGRTGEVNHLLGIHRDMTDYVPELAKAWKKLGYKQVLTGGQGLSHHARSIESRALRYIEEAPIGLAIGGNLSPFP